MMARNSGTPSSSALTATESAASISISAPATAMACWSGRSEMPGNNSTGALSGVRLDRMHDVMAGHVDAGEMPGLVTLVSRRGEIHVEAIGKQAFDSHEPMRRDTIFRIASLTKPVVAAAAMILGEECRLRLGDAVDPCLPELADRKVLRAIDAPLDDIVPAERAITLRDLLTFRLGHGAIIAYPERYPIQKAMTDAGIAAGPVLPSFSPDELMKRYGSLPLVHQAGERWLYNSGSDILGVLIARASGKTLETFLRERIFEPLGMNDTAFSVPEAKIDRLPTAQFQDPGGPKLGAFGVGPGGGVGGPPL